MTNPLLNWKNLPDFTAIVPEHVTPAIDTAIDQARRESEALLAGDSFGFEDFIVPLSEIREQVGRAWGPVSHLKAVKNSPALRKVYNENLPRITEFFVTLSQDERIFAKVQALRESESFSHLSSVKRKIVSDLHRDLILQGAELRGEKKARFLQLKKRMSEISSKFAENVLDETQAYGLFLRDRSEVEGIPSMILDVAHECAVEDKLCQIEEDGWKFTLDIPSYLPFMKHCRHGHLRRQIYEAYMTRATKGEKNNSPLMEELLVLRKELASLCEFPTYAEYSLADKMADTPKTISEFLESMAEKSRSRATRELEEMRQIKAREFPEEIQAWDIAYYSERLRQEKFHFSDEDIRPYFPESKVMEGLFTVVEKLYGVQARLDKAETWDDHVKFYSFFRDGEKVGSIYYDLYARPKKQGGAWMDNCVDRKLTRDRKIQNPVAYVTCNFSRPVGETPALFTHSEVETLFHETGHALHHILSQVDYLDASGINGVPWDGVELPSQFFENWVWQEETLGFLSSHYKSGESLPRELFDKMKAAKNLTSGLEMLRQVEYSLFDLGLHSKFFPGGEKSIDAYAKEINRRIAVYPSPTFARFANGFTHIFDGGYAAGYYSYKWAEVLSADCFSKFEEKGIFDRGTGLEFLKHILESGGTRDFMELFKAFREREPSIDPLLRHLEIA